ECPRRAHRDPGTGSSLTLTPASSYPASAGSAAGDPPRRDSVVAEGGASGAACEAAARSASATGLRRVAPSVPSRRGADANSVANAACTAITTPTRPTNRRDPFTFPSSAPQNSFNRALTRSTAVRPLYIRSNFFVARGSAGNRLRSTPRGTRTVLPYDFPALHIVDIGHSQPSCLAGQRYFRVSRSGSWPMKDIL